MAGPMHLTRPLLTAPYTGPDMAKTFQSLFNGGILGKGMYSRTDISKYQAGVSDAVNMFVRPQGGLSNRAGTELVGGWDPSTGSGYQRLIPFEFSTADTYQLEFADLVVRFIRDGSYILNSAITPQSVTSISAANPSQITMVNGTAAAFFTVGHLAYLSDPNGTHKLHQQVVKITAIAAAVISYQIIGKVALNATVGSWGTIGSGATLAPVYQVTSPYPIGILPELNFTQDVDTIFLLHPTYAPRSLKRIADDSWTMTSTTFAPSIDKTGLGTFVAGTGGGGTTNLKTYTYTMTISNDDTGEESYAAGSDIASLFDFTKAGAWINVELFGTVDALAALPVRHTVKVYRKDANIYGYVGVAKNGGSFTDRFFAPDYNINPPVSRSLFNAAGLYPSCGAFIEQRLSLAGADNARQVVEMSTSRYPQNFTRGLVPKDSDAISFRMRDQRMNRVVGIVPYDPPVILTTGGEWTIEGGDQKGYLTPTNPIIRPRSTRGSALRPAALMVGDSVMHVQGDRNTIRELLPASKDPSADLTLLCRQLFENKAIVSWDYAQSPDSIVWVVLDDGSLLAMTYLIEHEVWGWTKMQMGGTDAFVRDVSVIREGTADVPYFVVSRTIDGQTITTTERLAPRVFTDVTECYFVDAGFTIDTTAATELTGFLHLRGETVTVLADGNVIADLVVDSTGTLTLPVAADLIHVGLGYTSYFTTLGVDFGAIQGLGSTMARYKSTSEIGIQTVDSRGFAIGTEDGYQNEIREFSGVTPIPLTSATQVVTIEGDWQRDARIKVLQAYPLPLTVTGLAPDWELEDV